MLMTISNADKKFSDKVILNNGFLSVEDKDKIGIIGVNGTGKSTFLKILSGNENLDKGEILKRKGLKLNYLPQNPEFDESKSILEIVKEYLDDEEREQKEYEAKSALTKLGINDFNEKVTKLSGGQKKRVGLACALVKKCDVLLLDEPTNHLDNDMIEWLEHYLIKFKGAIIMVTHDRYFLERVCNRMVELERGNLNIYDVNYSAFLEAKAKREEYEEAVYRKRQNILRHELEWIRASVQARGTKSKERIARYYELASIEGPAKKESVDLSSVSSYLGKNTIEAINISKAFGDKVLFKDFSYNVNRNDRLGIIGPNGAGKTTLLNCLAKRIDVDSGEVKIGETVKLGYFSQTNVEMDPDKRLIDYIKDISDIIETNEGTISASQMLERFLFPKDMHYLTIRHLSGGEKRRLYLLSVLMGQPNILFLDEPTNDLDIDTLSILEDFLEEFKGAVITVSHDRYFLDRVVDHCLVFTKSHEIKEYIGGYSYYTMMMNNEIKEEVEAPKYVKENKKVTLTYNEKKALQQAEKDMEECEKRIKEIDNEMNNVSDFDAISRLSNERTALENKLNAAEEIWLELNSKLEG